MAPRMARRLSVTVHAAKQSIGERVASVQRVVRIAIKCERPVEERAVRFVYSRVLIVNSKLQVMRSADPRIIVGTDPHVISSEVRKTRVDIQLTGIRDSAEGGVGNQTVWIRGRIVLRNARREIRALVSGQALLR